MREGDVVLALLPQADGQLKNRPALFLRSLPPFGDALVCGISTQLSKAVQGFDEVIQPPDDDFGSSGLVSASVIRLGLFAVLPRIQLLGSIDQISAERRRRLLNNLSKHLISS